MLEAEIVPERGSHRATVVWLHGLGASGHDFVPIVPALALEGVRFVFPHAPERPVTLNGGFRMPAWYDIRSLEQTEGRNHAPHIREMEPELAALIESHPGPHLLAGFSQGGAMALHVGLRWPQPLLGILAMSCYLLLDDTLEAESASANLQTPILVQHGVWDEVVPIGLGEHSVERLRGQQRPVQWADYPMGHEVCPQQVHDLAGWFRERLG